MIRKMGMSVMYMYIPFQSWSFSRMKGYSAILRLQVGIDPKKRSISLKWLNRSSSVMTFLVKSRAMCWLNIDRTPQKINVVSCMVFIKSCQWMQLSRCGT